ncbi:MAG: hypothetical protein JNJ59_01010 [Deltaproteobacteria bacterium]|jgi:hypothetical protein|nr:hypothetical protein [Deltaproteobacteria bacterium]
MALPTRAHVFHLADLLAGHVRGLRCPSCGARGASEVLKKHLGVASIYRCGACELLFRPTGLQTGRVAAWYYSRLYGNQGIATEPQDDTRETALVRAREAGKDRSTLVATLLPLLPEGARTIGVVGASWGYELLCMEHLGLPLYGIEPGEPRREHGKRRFGLALFADAREARAAGHGGGLVMSSHVLEHIAELEATLDAVQRELTPFMQVHVTPRVDPFTSELAPTIGREHPLGVTEAFWRRWAARHGRAVSFRTHRPEPHMPAGELVTIVYDPTRVAPSEIEAIRFAGQEGEERA